MQSGFHLNIKRGCLDSVVLRWIPVRCTQFLINFSHKKEGENLIFGSFISWATMSPFARLLA